MPHFKDAQNQLYWLDDNDVEQWAKPEWTQITDEEAEAIRKANEPVVYPKDAIKAEIDSLERQQIMPRATREFMLLSMEAQFTPELLEVNPGYKAVKAFDEQIKALRAQL